MGHSIVGEGLGEEQPLQTRDNMTRAWNQDTVGVSFHSVQLEVKFKAGSEERPGRSGPRAQFWKS